MAGGIEVSLLGPVRALVDGAEVRIDGFKPRALLAIMALSPGRPVTLDELATRLWGESLPGDVRGSLYTCVLRLRRTLGATAVESTPDGYRLNVAALQVDVHRFRQLVSTARESADPQRRRAALVRALQLVDDPPLADTRCDYLERDVRAGLYEEILGATEARLDLDLAAERPGDAVAELSMLTGRWPLRESLWVRLMRALHLAGRDADALTAYAAVRQRLAEELGVDPGAQLQAAYQTLLAAEEPAPTAVVPEQLPADGAHFTGRAAALDALDQLARRRDAASVAVVCGMGGVGKTATVLHWANRSRREFPDGQLYLNLRGYGPGMPVEPAQALEQMLLAVGAPAAGIPADVDARSALLRTLTAHRRILVVLDNAADSDQARALLPSGASVAVVTSRSSLSGLAAQGAARIPLGTLTRPEAQAVLARILGADRVERESAAAARIIALCGGLPLALRIIADRAARLADVPLTEFAGELAESRLAGLEAADGEAVDLRAIFGWSYGALKPPAARLFRLLSVHPGTDVSVPAAAGIAGIADAAAHSLLRQLAATHLLEEYRPGRYRYHDLLREYAVELAESEDSSACAAARERLYSWYLHAIVNAKYRTRNEPAVVEIPAPVDPIRPLAFASARQAAAWCVAEHGNVIAIVTMAAGLGQHAYAWKLGMAFSRALEAHGHIDDRIATGQVAVESARRTGDRSALARTLNTLGISYSDAHRFVDARTHYDQALAAWRESDYLPGQMEVLDNLAILARRTGNPDQAVVLHKAALTIAERFGSRAADANVLNNMAYDYLALDQPEAAHEHATRAIGLRPDPHTRGRAVALHTLGDTEAALDRIEAAMGHYEQALLINRELDNQPGQGVNLMSIGQLRDRMGDGDGARRAWAEAHTILNDIGDPRAVELRAKLAPDSPDYAAT